MQLTTIFGAELKNGKGFCVNYLKRIDLYEKNIIFAILSSQKWFEIYKIMPVLFVLPMPTNEQVVVWVAFGTNRQFHIKLSLGTVIPSQLKANNL